jgi:2-dehydro-3-deoxygluconokinase
MLEFTCEGDLRTARNFTRGFGGDTYNTAVAASHLGSSVGFMTRIGNDIMAQALQENMIKENVELACPRPAKGPTGMYMVAVNGDGQRDFAYYRKDSAASQFGPEDVNPELIKNAKVVYASGITMGISERCRQAVIKAFTIAQEAGVMTAFDPNYREILWQSESKNMDAMSEILPLVDVFLPSFPEDTAMMVSFTRPEQVVDYFLFKDIKLVVVKAGVHGCYMGYKKEMMHFPAMAIKAVDTTGAGDAFNGGFLHGLVTGESLQQCARLAITTASLKVLNRGSAGAMPAKEAVYSRAYSY